MLNFFLPLRLLFCHTIRPIIHEFLLNNKKKKLAMRFGLPYSSDLMKQLDACKVSSIDLLIFLSFMYLRLLT
jgi:hypothetical protein